MRLFAYGLLALLLCFCQAKDPESQAKIAFLKENPKPPQATEYAMDAKPILIRGAKIMTANGDIFEKANLYMKNGLIEAVSENEIVVDQDTTEIDGTGLTLTPGIVDVHSHMGVYPLPSVDAHADGNEMVRPVTADVWAEHSFWPQDPSIWRALSGGVTTIQVLPGSGNLFGGRTFTAKLIPELSAREMRFSGAPQGLKMACGENPKRVYKSKNLMTRMGNMAGYRKAFQEALEYAREQESPKKDDKGKPPKRNLVSETLMKVMKGEILVHFHCYRADDIGAILDLAKEFGFKIRAIHHGLESYKIAKRLAKEDVATATWSDWWGFKAEAFDGIPYNVALLENAGARAIVHSDSEIDIQFLNVEAGKALAAAKKMGLNITEDQALAWITKNAAWALGLDHKIGTLQQGKMADVVAWDGHPFSIYSKTKLIFINGKIVFDRDKKKRPRSDFEVGFNDMDFFDGRNFTPPPLKQKIQWGDGPLPLKRLIDDDFVIINTQAFINGSWKKKVSVRVSAGQIAEINDKPITGDFVKIDGEGLFLTPGLVHMVSNVGLFDVSLDSSAQDLRNSAKLPTPDFQTIDSLNLDNVRLAIDRSEGVTTALAGVFGPLLGSQAVIFDLDGKTIVKKRAAGIGTLAKRRFANPNRSAMWSTFRQLLDDSWFYLNKKKDYWDGDAPDLLVSHRHLEAMTPIITGKRPWILGVDRADDISRLLRSKNTKAGKNINWILLGGGEAWMKADQIRKAKIPVMLTPSYEVPQTFDKTRARFDQAAYLHNQGVPVIIQGDGGHGNTRTRQQAGLAVKYGLEQEAALKAITENPARALKIKRGRISLGAKAHLVLWTGDPLEPTSWAQRIWINGKEQSLRNRQWDLGQKYLQRQEQE